MRKKNRDILIYFFLSSVGFCLLFTTNWKIGIGVALVTNANIILER